MDSIHDGAVLARLFAVWDSVEELINQRPASALLIFLTCFGLLVSQQWLDGLCIAALVSLFNHVSSVTSDRHFFAAAQGILFVCLVIVGSMGWRDSSLTYVKSDDVTHGPAQSRRSRNGFEEDVEKVFQSYLRHLTHTSPSSIEVEYIPCGDSKQQHSTFSSPTAGTNPTKMIFKVLHPEFYSRFVHYAHDSEAVFNELAESKTIWVNRPELLPDIFLKKGSPPLEASSLVDFVCFELIRRLRRRPRALDHDTAGASSASGYRSDIRAFRISSMDAYVLAQDDTRLRRMYRKTVLELFIADRFFGGSTRLFLSAIYVIRMGLWVSAAAFIFTSFVTI